jgi:hypothetical protein
VPREGCAVERDEHPIGFGASDQLSRIVTSARPRRCCADVA